MKNRNKAVIFSVIMLGLFSGSAVYGMDSVPDMEGISIQEAGKELEKQGLTAVCEVKAEEEKNNQSYYDAEGEEFRVYSDEEELRRLQEGMDGTSYQVSLERFRNDSSEYQYSDISWKSSFDEVQEKLEDRASEYEVEGTLSDREYRYLKPTAVQELEGQKGELHFEFFHDELQTVRYDFSLEGDYETWFQRQIDSLTDLYGEEFVKEETENEELGFTERLCKWEHGKTSLQAVLMTGENVKPSATIAVVNLEE